MIDKTVKPSSAGDYWQAVWYDSRGKRCRKNIGRRDEMSKRQAQKVCGDLAESFGIERNRRDVGQSPMLGPWLTTYTKLRTDLCEASLVWHRLVVARLKEHFGDDTRMDKITRAGADEFVAWVSGLKSERTGETIAAFTAHKYVTVAKEIMGWALRHDAIPINPFDRVRMTAPKLAKAWPYITPDQTQAMIEAAPDHSWQCLIALARFAGLRRGEALRLTWDKIDWDKRIITVQPEGDEITTKQNQRHPPISPVLYAVLRDAFEAAPERAVRVCNLSNRNIERTMERIIKRAGLEPYAKPLHTLRKCIETDWLATLPVLDVVGWLGNSPDVAAKHYNRTTPETIARVTGGDSEVDRLRAELAELRKRMDQVNIPAPSA